MKTGIFSPARKTSLKRAELAERGTGGKREFEQMADRLPVFLLPWAQPRCATLRRTVLRFLSMKTIAATSEKFFLTADHLPTMGKLPYGTTNIIHFGCGQSRAKVPASRWNRDRIAARMESKCRSRESLRIIT